LLHIEFSRIAHLLEDIVEKVFEFVSLDIPWTILVVFNKSGLDELLQLIVVNTHAVS
jgi:hypothetical protein